MAQITYGEFFKKLTGCFTGKAVGGTLGMPYEGIYRGLGEAPYNVTYYDPVPAEMVGNDDLDLQVVWLECIRRRGLPVNRKHLAEAWAHIGFAPDEYGIAHDNIKSGLWAPLSGYYNNKFQNGMGGAIRSELWASLAPGNPALAARLAREDACVDHYGEGVDGCLFFAALESAAYLTGDRETLVEIGLSFLHEESMLAKGVRDTVGWWKEGLHVREIRARIIRKYGVHNWTDVTVNGCLTVLALLEGRGDFDTSLCLVVNMGYDADCTAATLGSILGIIDPGSIAEKWTRPIGGELKLSAYIVGTHESGSIREFCEQIAALAIDAGKFYGSGVRITGAPPLEEVRRGMSAPWAKADITHLDSGYNSRESLICTEPLAVTLTYPQSVALRGDEWSGFTARFQNPTGETVNAAVRLRVPDYFCTAPSSFDLTIGPLGETAVSFQVRHETGAPKKRLSALDFICTVGGLRFVCTAGIVTGFPWTRKKTEHRSAECPGAELFRDAEELFADAFFQPVPPGEFLYATEFKAIAPRLATIVCQGSRPMRVWLNGELLIDYDAEVFEPAVHRGPSEKAVLRTGWNRVVIHVSGGAEEGELFFGVGEPVSWKWLDEAEWRRAAFA